MFGLFWFAFTSLLEYLTCTEKLGKDNTQNAWWCQEDTLGMTNEMIIGVQRRLLTALEGHSFATTWHCPCMAHFFLLLTGLWSGVGEQSKTLKAKSTDAAEAYFFFTFNQEKFNSSANCIFLDTKSIICFLKTHFFFHFYQLLKMRRKQEIFISWNRFMLKHGVSPHKWETHHHQHSQGIHGYYTVEYVTEQRWGVSKSVQFKIYTTLSGA